MAGSSARPAALPQSAVDEGSPYHAGPRPPLQARELPPETTIRLVNLADVSQRYERPTGSLLPDGGQPPFKHITGLTHLDILEDSQQSGYSRHTPLYFVAHGARTGIWLHLVVTTVDEHARDRLFCRLLDLLPTERVAALHVSARAAGCLARIEWVLRRTPALAALVLRCADARVFTEPAATVRWQDVAMGVDSLIATRPQTILDDVAHALTPRRGAAVHLPVPCLKALTIEMSGTWEAKLADGFVKALAARKRCGCPLRSVACGAKKVDDPSLAQRLREHVEIVTVVEEALWDVTNIPSVWMVKNDYWSLYARESRYGWEVPHDTYKMNSSDV